MIFTKKIIVILFLIGIAFAVFPIGEFIQRTVNFVGIENENYTLLDKGINAKNDLKTQIKYSLPMPGRAILPVVTKLPVYNLKIPKKSLKRINYEIVSNQKFTYVNHDYPDQPNYSERKRVKAYFLRDGKMQKIKVNLRGLVIGSHYTINRPSLRLIFPRTSPYNGATAWNLNRDIFDKAFTSDLTIFNELSLRDILTLRSRFVVLVINGKSLGVYQEFEHVGEGLIARHNRAEGPILNGDGMIFGKANSNSKIISKLLTTFHSCFEASFQNTNILKNINSDKNVLENKKSKDCSYHQFKKFFDADKIALSMAYTTLLGSTHGWDVDNVRFFFDTARGKFETIPWDYGISEINIVNNENFNSESLWKYLISMDELRNKRDQYLWEIINQRIPPMIKYSNFLYSSVEDSLKLDLAFRRQILERRSKKIPLLYQQNAQILKKIYESNKVKIHTNKNLVSPQNVLINNFGKAPVIIQSIESVSNESLNKYPFSLKVSGALDGIPGEKIIQIEGRIKNIKIENGLTNRILTDKEIEIIEVVNPIVHEVVKNESIWETDLKGVSIEGEKVFFGPGRVNIEENFVIPEGYNAVFLPGLDLKLAEGTSIFLHGSLSSIGSKRSPIYISGFSEEKETWGVLAVKGTRLNPAKVNLIHTHISGGKGGQHDYVNFTGSFSAHDAIVTIRHSSFVNGQSNDGVNIKYGKVNIEKNNFFEQLGDGIDLDFCQGEMTNNTIKDIKGDAVDLSGSVIRLSYNNIFQFGDKGISVGEQTNAEISDNLIVKGMIGVAVKDGSVAKVLHNSIAKTKIGFSVYLKKPIFPPPLLEISNSLIYDTQSPLIKDSLSSISIVNSTQYSIKKGLDFSIGGLKTVLLPITSQNNYFALLSCSNEYNCTQGVRQFIGSKQSTK